MKLNDLQIEAKSRGVLVFAFDQSQTIFIKKSKELSRLPGPWGHVRTGFCMGLAVHWIHDLYHDRNFHYGPDKICRLPPFKAVRTQYKAHKSFDQEDKYKSWQAALREYSMHFDKSIFDDEIWGFKTLTLYNVVNRRKGGFGIGMTGMGGKHAWAIFKDSKGFINIFDANYGHLRIEQLKSREMIDWFLERTKYRTRYHLHGFIQGIKLDFGKH